MTARKKTLPLPRPGAIVLVHLREPREKFLGMLLSLETPGIWVRGINVNTFEDWARQLGGSGEDGIAPSTLFLPFLRVEKMALDEPNPPVPSMAERFREMARIGIEEALGE